MRRTGIALVVVAWSGRALAAPCPAGPDLVLVDLTCEMSGVHTFGTVSLTRSRIDVVVYDGADKVGTGNLELRANTITIDSASTISARGKGYQTKLCGNGVGPNTAFGAGDSFAVAAGVVTLTDASAAFKPSQVGRLISVSGATTAANNGAFRITAVPSATTVQYANASAVAQAFPGTYVIDDIGAGRGGCSVFDSGGGGAHFGRGGRGTRDNPVAAAFYEDDCSQPVANGGTAVKVTYSTLMTPTREVATCSPATSCRNGDGLPSVAGTGYYHSIYEPEFGASGGDKGCLDGDGFDPNDPRGPMTPTAPGVLVAGMGGGRIVLAAVTGSGQVTIDGTLDANGKRGCGNGNDSGGGGAGGTVVVVGSNVTIGETARISASGGLGGDTQGISTDPTGECVAPAQQGTTADDCGGGGGGGIVSVLSGVTPMIHDRAVFDVNGAAGGVSSLCRGEAGGGVGELQISNGYIGEFCDGYDNDFDGVADDNLPALDCDGMSMMSCIGGIPQTCPAQVPACQLPVTDSRSRFTVILDSSGSMLGDLAGVPTHGDGSLDHPGLDHNGNMAADDSRLFKAKAALTQVIAAYPNIDFTLARYHQDQSTNRNCQTAHNFECNEICCSYDNPTNNTGPAPTPACLTEGTNPLVENQVVLKDSPGDECINYAGNCGPPRRGADVLVGFGSDINNYLMWLDGTETSFDNTQTQGAYCNFAGGGNCELRGTGPTPLASSLQAVEDYLTPIKACDLGQTCRRYGVILLTDGAESCQGDPVAAAAALRAKGIDTFVIGFSTQATETAQLNAIAAAGGTGTAFLVGSDDALANALATIVSGSIVFETCNNLDDDCDVLVDEDFPQKGNACDNGLLGVCRGTGVLGCTMNGAGLQCNITNPGGAPMMEVCNGLDDDCDGAIDDGINCTPGCVPTNPIDLCNGLDDDCDGAFEEDDPIVGTPCGSSNVSPCMFGTNACIGGTIQCVGAVEPGAEQCNGLDDDCDGMADNTATCPGATSCVEGGCRMLCAGGEFPCPAGFKCQTTPGGDFCVPSACATCAPNEVCMNDTCIDPCAGVTCGALEECRFGTCVDCNVLGCPTDQVCSNSMCVDDPCLAVDCTAGCTAELGCSCNDGICIPNCDDTRCPEGQRCATDGTCTADVCAGVDCDEFQVCIDGACAQDPCAGISCRAGQVCTDGMCIEDPCKLVTCGELFHCEVRGGAGLCVPDLPAGTQILVQPGGSGCAAGGGGGGLVPLLLVAGWLVVRRRRTPTAAAAALAVTVIAGCDLNPYDLGTRSALSDARTGTGTGDGGGDGDGGGGDGGGGSDAASCVPIGVDDQCNEVDDDCDGTVDNTFDKQVNTNHCGTCNHRCFSTGAVQECQAGQCAFVACQPGFANLDGDPLTCEYMCPLFPTIAEDCNGVDDDCDGTIDETLPAPPTGLCRVTASTPCAGTTMVCETRGGQTRWWCDYADDVEFNPMVPNGIVLQEQLCDGKDGDCDGVADDSFSDLGQECDNGGKGVCRDVGVRVCDTGDPSQTRCDLTVLPDAQSATVEACDGLDNNCDGIVDNSTGPDRVIDAMTHVMFGAFDFYIDTYEASHPDATALATGVSSGRSCSTPGVLPWRSVTFATAQAACTAAGKVLCTGTQWEAACEGAAGDDYPYGNTFAPGTCNTESYDGIAGGTDDDVLLATGAAATCRAAGMGAFDLSGNLKEWTDDITGQTGGGVDIAVQRGGTYDTPAVAATCEFRLTRAAVNIIEPETGFRCCRATAP